jgi:hypothetical protein
LRALIKSRKEKSWNEKRLEKERRKALQKVRENALREKAERRKVRLSVFALDSY